MRDVRSNFIDVYPDVFQRDTYKKMFSEFSVHAHLYFAILYENSRESNDMDTAMEKKVVFPPAYDCLFESVGDLPRLVVFFFQTLGILHGAWVNVENDHKATHDRRSLDPTTYWKKQPSSNVSQVVLSNADVVNAVTTPKNFFKQIAWAHCFGATKADQVKPHVIAFVKEHVHFFPTRFIDGHSHTEKWSRIAKIVSTTVTNPTDARIESDTCKYL